MTGLPDSGDPLAPLWAPIDEFGPVKVAGIIRHMGGPIGPAAGTMRGTLDLAQWHLLDEITKLVEQDPPSPEVVAAMAWAASHRGGPAS
jgi:hypothetical protein